jgi:NADPH-dependent curcumin reductase CurA
METNLQFRLAARPVGMVKDSDWQQVDEPLRELADGEIRVKVLYLSLDPAMRGWMNEGKSYIRPVAIGEVMRAGGVGVVVESKSPGLRWATMCPAAPACSATGPARPTTRAAPSTKSIPSWRR